MNTKTVIKLCFIGVALFLSIFFVNLVWKIPLEGKKISNATQLGLQYYKGLLGGLYIKGIDDCSSWFISTCDGPDIFSFLRFRLVKGAAPDSFEFVGSISKPLDWTARSDIYKDKDHIIIYDEVVPDSDPQSIRIMYEYAIDKNNVYMFDSVFRNLDTSTFQMLSCGFFRDSSNVYNNFNGNVPLDFIDTDSFEMIDRKGKACNLVPYVAKDKNSFYQSDASGVRIVGTDNEK